MHTTTDTAANDDISPALLVDTMFAFRKTASIKAALEIDVFSMICDGADTVAALAAKSGDFDFPSTAEIRQIRPLPCSL